ncbi:hypothetical protein [Roseicella aerolata]|uniref:Uncharacterized protein n=1 Tax=Roseicella aerolata TaxID=2883479 RepID=A0A9X1L9H0_9PROT|nr:hypothetical protein [Roseicella aerolata]MCB4821155.1 hypothetical protein [Roseicella aerolata]
MNRRAAHALRRDRNVTEMMMRATFRLLLPALLLFGLAACQQEGPGERAGRSLDRAGQNVRDAVDPPRGPAERLGRSVDRTLN